MDARINLLPELATQVNTSRECDLIVKSAWNLEARVALMLADGTFQTDRAGEQLSLQQLIDIGRTNNHHVTSMCTPPNSGIRMRINRNEDGVLEFD